MTQPEGQSAASGSAERALARLVGLQEVTAALSEAATAAQVANVIIEEGLAALGAAAGSLALLTDTGPGLEVVGAIGYDDEVVAEWRSIPVEADLPLAEAARTKTFIALTSVEERDRLYPHLASFGDRHKALAAIPLLVENRSLGALGLSFDDERAFEEEDRAFMLLLAQQCAQALQRARAYEAERRARRAAEAAQERLAFLAEASRILGASLDHRATLEKVAHLAVPWLADWCVIDLAGTDDGFEEAVIAHVDETKVELARDLRRRYPPDWNSPHGLARVMHTGEPLLYESIDAAELEVAAMDQEHLQALVQLDIESAMVVPLVARGNALGAITFATSTPERHFEENDLVFAEDLARRAALALDNSRLFQETLESRERFAYLARTLQQNLLPASIPSIEGIDTAVRYRAAATGNEVGGDFYDLFSMGDDAWALVIGDVCGKGARAASITGLARHTIRALSMREKDPEAILRSLNEVIHTEPIENHEAFCTVAMGKLERDGAGARVSMSSGGHPPPHILRADGSLEEAPVGGMVLGLFADPDLNSATIELGPGDSLFFYTDGVVDARRGPDTFGEERLEAVLKACSGSTAEEIAGTVERAIIDFWSEGSRDDIAMMVVRVDPSASAAARSTRPWVPGTRG